jgi:hypothetical protein
MISRRNVVLGIGTTVAIGRCRAASAELACQDLMFGTRVCTVGVRIRRVRPVYQKKLHWCWAACIEAIFDLHDHKVSQGRIVDKVFGTDVDAPADGPQIVEAVNGEWTDDDGDTFDATAEVLWDTQFAFARPDAILQAARELESDNPLILGALGHAVLLTALTYTGNAFNVRIDQATVRDPWPFNQNRRLLTGVEAMQTQFLAKIDVC